MYEWNFKRLGQSNRFMIWDFSTHHSWPIMNLGNGFNKKTKNTQEIPWRIIIDFTKQSLIIRAVSIRVLSEPLSTEYLWRFGIRGSPTVLRVQFWARILPFINRRYYVILSLFTTLVFLNTRPSVAPWAQIHSAGKIPPSLGNSQVLICNNPTFLQGTWALPWFWIQKKLPLDPIGGSRFSAYNRPRFWPRYLL